MIPGPRFCFLDPFSNYSSLGKIFIGQRFGKMTHLVPVVLVRGSIKHVPNEIVEITWIEIGGIFGLSALYYTTLQQRQIFKLKLWCT
ncbi:hypothetical protein RDI58_023143 [Solanum bulbocastanum]|uniref:Uncharacterized protein n=1 Tax=Solanum bulbocastanum TaxID=147425 RepID=A0AAN8T3Z6_SOLBU